MNEFYSPLPRSLTIGVLRGGPSSEYDVSLKTGGTVLSHLSETHKPVDVFISRDGLWHTHGIEKSPQKILKHVDVVFNALHGEFGEDGGVQEILNHLGVPYTGSDRLNSAMAMSKWRTKEKAKLAGVKTPVYIVVRHTDSIRDKATEIFHSIPHPLIVKPVRGGSSIGVRMVKSFPELFESLEELSQKGSDALVEEYISGKEATCGVLDNFRNQKIYSLPPIQIIHPNKGSFWNYESKYNGESQELCPGNFSQKEKTELEHLAKLLHSHLGLRHYSRSDFIVSPRRGIYFLETNSLPGLTEESFLPKSLSAVGVSMKEFLHHVLWLAIGKR